MAYLESKQHVHRDLATRNVLCLGDGTCLVADFGMSRALSQKQYYRVREGSWQSGRTQATRRAGEIKSNNNPLDFASPPTRLRVHPLAL